MRSGEYFSCHGEPQNIVTLNYVGSVDDVFELLRWFLKMYLLPSVPSTCANWELMYIYSGIWELTKQLLHS
jgi:hypothetical protein